MKGYQLGLYEKALPPQLSWREKLDITQASGFDWLEISIDETDEKLHRLDWPLEEISALAQDIRSSGCPIRTMCLSGHRKYPFGARDPQHRKKSLAIMQKAVNLAATLGIRIVQLAGYDVYYEEGSPQTRNWFLENLTVAASMAAEKGVLLGFETMETPFMDTVEKAMVYVDSIRSPYLGVYPDIGNLTNAAGQYGGGVVDDLQKGTGHIFAAHLKETRPGVYRNMNFGTGHTRYEPAVQALYAMGVRMFTGEFWYLGEEDWRQGLSQAAGFLHQKIRAGIQMAGKRP